MVPYCLRTAESVSVTVSLECTILAPIWKCRDDVGCCLTLVVVVTSAVSLGYMYDE